MLLKYSALEPPAMSVASAHKLTARRPWQRCCLERCTSRWRAQTVHPRCLPMPKLLCARARSMQGSVWDAAAMNHLGGLARVASKVRRRWCIDERRRLVWDVTVQ
uniref:Uncharacterized protein n=1 Tax=Haptolina brevifila TaxID=156173 RepID=A0A7S2HZZ8_9EUKA